MSDSMDAVSHARSLNEERMRVWNEGQALLDDVARSGKGMNSEARRKWERINARLDDLDEQRDVYVAADRRKNEAEQIRESEFRQYGDQRVLHRERAEQDMVRRFLAGDPDAGQKDPDTGRRILSIPVEPAWRESQLLRDGVPAYEARALAWDTGSIASGVPVTTARTLYQYMEASMAMFRLPTTKFPTASGEQMKLPKLAAHAIATQVAGQGTVFAGTDPSFASMTLDAFKYGELVIVASEVITDVGFDVTDLLMKDTGRALGRRIDADLVVGSGSGQPNGVMTALAAAGAGSITTGGSLIAPTYEKLVDLVYTVNDSYRSGGNAAWLMRDLTAGVLRKLRDGAGGTIGAVLWNPSLTAGIQGGQPDHLLGFPVYPDPNVASLASSARALAFGDFSAYYIRTVGNVIVERDDSRYFDTDQSAFRAKWRIDGDLIDQAAIASMVQAV